MSAFKSTNTVLSSSRLRIMMKMHGLGDGAYFVVRQSASGVCVCVHILTP